MLVVATARFCARHRWWVIVAWLVLALASVAGTRALGPADPESLTVPGSDSAAASVLVDEVSGGDDTGISTSTVLLVASGPITDHADEVTRVADGLRAVDGIVDVTDPLAPTTSGRPATTPDGTGVQLRVQSQAEVDGTALTAVVTTARDAGLQVGVGQPLLDDLAASHSRTSEAVGLAVALVVLLVALGSAWAAGVPIVTAVIGLLSGLAVLDLVRHAVAVPNVVPTLATMLGLGVGIDYALFQVARQGRSLREETDRVAAVARTAATSGTAVAFAGVTVAVSICALAITGVDFVSWLGWGTAVVVAVVLLGSLTLTPALLAVLGPRVAARRVRTDLDRSGWARFAGTVARRPWTAVGASTLLLAVLAAPAVSLTLGQSSDADWPLGSERRISYDLTTAQLGAGSSAVLQVALALDPAATSADDPRLAAVADTLAAVPGVTSVAKPTLATDGTAAVLRVQPATGAADPATADVVAGLRAAEAPAGVTAHVGGPTATRLDLSDRIAQRLPWLVLATVLVAAGLLALAFRSVVVPLKAAAMDLVSVAAAYGVVTAVFERGWGAALVGLDGPVAIDAYVPMMLFAVLFGLSMDYEVFLLSAVREHWLQTRDNTLAVRRGLAETGRIITAAALIMFSVFASFVLTDNPVIKVFGVGLAVAVAVDATVVRTVLGPAVMVLTGRWTWWWPGTRTAQVPPDHHDEATPVGETGARVPPPAP